MTDGVALAATLYLPDTDTPQPCLLEALPYRKDDLTSSYASSYERLRDRHGYAVCRLDLRGTGSSGGDALDEYQPAEQRDLAEVIAWLAAQDWCDGQVGMWGTSYSGFNSLQMACERPPALKAICAIYATDDRWTDDVHWRGGALRLVDQVDYNHYMTAMNVLPPVPAVWGEGWEDEWRRRLETHEPWVLTWLRESRHGAYWGHGSVRLGARRRGLRADRGADDAGGGLGRRLPQQHLPHGRAARRTGHAAPAARRVRGRTPTRRPRCPARGSTSTPSSPAGSTTGCAGRRSHEDGCDVFVRSSTRPEPDLDLHEGRWVRLPSVPPTARRRAVAARAARSLAGARRRRYGGLDRLRRAPALGAVRRPAPRRRPVADLGPRAAGRRRRRAPARAAAGQRGRAGRLAVGEALRRLPRRHLGPGHPRHARPGVPRRRARRARRR